MRSFYKFLVFWVAIYVADIKTVFSQTPDYYFLPAAAIGNVFPLGSTTNKSQYLYYPTDFNIPVSAGVIKTIYFRSSGSIATTTFTDLTVKMAMTGMTQFVSGPWFTPLTTVFQSNITFTNIVAQTWHPIELQTPFYWDGVSNLIIELSQEGYTTGITLLQGDIANRRLYGTTIATTGTVQQRIMHLGLDMGSENDGGVASLVSPAGGDICSGIHPVVVNCRNYGSNPLTSFDVHWTLNGVPQTPVSISNVNLNPFMTAGDNMNVTLGNAALPYGSPIQLKAWTINPNAVLDEFNDNDTLNVALASTFEGIILNEMNDTVICRGDSLILDAGYNANTDYTWSNGTQAQVNIITQPGTYWVWAYNPSGCQAFDTFTVTLSPPPSAGPYVVGIDNGAGNFTFNLPMVSDADEWAWDFGDASPVVYGAAPITHTYTQAGSYMVSVTLSNKCGSTKRYGNIFTSGSNIREIETIAKSVDVYPSPATNVVTIFNKSDKFSIKEVNIFNSVGQRVFAAIIEDKKSNIDVSSFASGLYTIQVITDKGNVTKKVEVVR